MLAKHQRLLVPAQGFDELMEELQATLERAPLDALLASRGVARAENYKDRHDALSKTLAAEPKTTAYIVTPSTVAEKSEITSGSRCLASHAGSQSIQTHRRVMGQFIQIRGRSSKKMLST